MNRWAFFALLLAGSAAADVITLNDGSQLQGQLKRDADGWMLTTPDGAIRSIPEASVKSIQLGDAPASPAAEALASLRRSSEGLPDINQIIERYQSFIEGAKDPEVIEQARADQDNWRLKKAQGYIKYAGKWSAPADVAAAITKSMELTESAREMIRLSHYREADQLLTQALQVDSINPAAHYLRGVSMYRQDKPAESRRSFETANSALPRHPATLNNLAIVFLRQKQTGAGLTYFDQAMQASGPDQAVLDNVSELLGTLPDDQRKGAAYTRVFNRFSELEVQLQQKMAEQKMYRWGSAWIDEGKLNELKAAEKQARDKLKELQIENDRLDARVTEIDQDIARNQRVMDDMLATQHNIRDKDGKRIYVPLPSSYYDLERDNARLRDQQNSVRERQAAVVREIQVTRQMIPVPKFTGLQQLIGIEGMPIRTPPVPPRAAP